MTSRSANRNAGRRPGAGVDIDSGRLIRMRQVKLQSRSDLALKMSNGPCGTCGRPYSHAPECPRASEFTITPDAIAKIENGYRRPKPITLGKLCAVLECQPEDLLPALTSGRPKPCLDCKATFGHESGCRYAT